MPAKASPATTHQARWKLASSTPPGFVPVPTMATSTATPRASPVWRIMLITAEPVAKERGGSDAVAVPIMVGRIRPVPTPPRIMPPRTPLK
jgi:hypothetical protein